jgi:putative hydrolase of HD superfamily
MLTLLIELQRLKRLERTGWALRGMPAGTESVASHSFGVSVTAMLLADELVNRGTIIDTEELLRMALVHDWAETRVGDMPRTASNYFGAAARRNAETEALADMTQGLSTGNLYRELFERYEERQSLEARLVKAADVIDLLVQLLALERSGARGLDEFWEVARDPGFEFESPVRELITEVLNSLLEQRKVILTSAAPGSLNG